MSSSLKNSSTLFVLTDKKTGEKKYILASEKTGYRSVWINGTHYYYNSEAHSRNGDMAISLQKMIEEKQNKNRSPLNSKISVRRATGATTRSNANSNNGSLSEIAR